MDQTEHASPLSATTTATASFGLLKVGIAVGFVLAVILLTYLYLGHISMTLVVASSFGAYMAMNIGANDVANNVGPAVGARAMTLMHAVLIAAIFEALGAIIAGGDVVTTIKGGIISPEAIDSAESFVWLMMAALLAGALWLNLATWLGAPVSTTHSIVGGVLGAGVAAAGWSVANWGTLGSIAASWVISPFLGGAIAAGILYFIKHNVTYQDDLMAASRRIVPILIGVMAWAFATYLMLKGFKQIIKVPTEIALGGGAAVGIIVYLLNRSRLAKTTLTMSNDRASVNKLFTVPLMFAAALLSFAHGSNDVANAIGPLAAIHDAIMTSTIGGKAPVPLWIMLLGAVGLSVGLALYGPRLIKTVGSEITEIDPTRAYCIAMSAAITVIIASRLGLPVSTTHVTIGAVFGVGFMREYLKSSYARVIEEIRRHHQEQDATSSEVEAFLRRFEAASVIEKDRMLKELKQRGKAGETSISKRERKGLRKVYRKNMVKRSVVFRIVAAWIITVPASALMAAFIYFAIRGAMLP